MDDVDYDHYSFLLVFNEPHSNFKFNFDNKFP